MNFSPRTKAWIQLVSLVIGTGCAATTAAILGGAKLWTAIGIGLGVGCTNVYHALSASPNDQPAKNPMQDIGKP